MTVRVPQPSQVSLSNNDLQHLPTTYVDRQRPVLSEEEVRRIPDDRALAFVNISNPQIGVLRYMYLHRSKVVDDPLFAAAFRHPTPWANDPEPTFEAKAWDKLRDIPIPYLQHLEIDAQRSEQRGEDAIDDAGEGDEDDHSEEFPEALVEDEPVESDLVS
jgi:hypothetical protein